MRDPLSVAMLYTSRPAPTGKETVFGAGVAVSTFLEALDRHGAGLDLTAYVTGATDDLEQRLRRAAGRRGSRVAVRPHVELFDPHRRVTPSVWHDLNADVRAPFQLRAARATRLYPITVTHHTVSYGFQLHDWFLALLLGDVRAFDSIVCTSRAVRDAIANTLAHVTESLERAHGVRLPFRGRLDLVPLGVDVDRFRPRPRAATRKQLGLPVDRPIVMWIGRFSAADKADLLPLVRVFADLARDRPRRAKDSPLLVLAGTDRRYDSAILADYAERLGIRDRVRIVTKLDPAVRHLWFAAADVFVSPVDNPQETFGLTPIEAMACGVPAVVSDWNGYRDTVVDGVSGFRIPTLWTRCDADATALATVAAETMLDQFALGQSVVVDPATLRDRIALLLERPDLRAQMGAAGRAAAVATFAWDKVIGAYIDLWRELVARAGDRAFRPARAGAYNLPPFFTAYAHYATRTLPPGTRIALTPAGRAMLAGDEPMPVYHADEVTIFEVVLEAALAELGDRGERGATLAGLSADLGRGLRITDDTALRHIMWLVKHGLAVEHARAAPAPPPTRRARSLARPRA